MQRWNLLFFSIPNKPFLKKHLKWTLVRSYLADFKRIVAISQRFWCVCLFKIQHMYEPKITSSIQIFQSQTFLTSKFFLSNRNSWKKNFNFPARISSQSRTGNTLTKKNHKQNFCQITAVEIFFLIFPREFSLKAEPEIRW
jgi:hypothetical protein